MTSNENVIIINNLYNSYKYFEDKFKPQGTLVFTNNTPVNFKESLSTPIHRWFAYKEGFSPSFVREFLNRFNLNNDSIIFDPFGGIGTTVLEASLNGFEAYSMDVNPLGNFASRIKSHIYTPIERDDIKNCLKKLKETYNYPLIDSVFNDTVKSYFDKITLESIERIKNFIQDINSPITHDLFKLALLSIIENISTHRKDGNGLKKKKKTPEPVLFEKLRNLLAEKVELYLEDISITKPIFRGSAHILEHSCLLPYKLEKKADLILTSPPYANCFDYSKVYLNELWIGNFFNKKEDQQLFREKSVSSHVHYTWKRNDDKFSSKIVNEYIYPILKEKKLWSRAIPLMLEKYFSDMGRCLYNISTNLNHGAHIGFVVGNSVYGGLIIATDLIISDIAEKIGYKVISLEIYRKLTASSQQMKIIDEDKIKFLRETLIILQWP